VSAGSPEAAESARSAYRAWLTVPTRWNDNDVYGHVNNVQYYAFFDTVINEYLIREGGLDIHRGDVIGLCAESQCTFSAGFEFPEPVQAGMRVGKLGRSSVRYEVGLFHEGEDKPAATGYFVHVFVDRGSRQPVEIPPRLRGSLEAIAVVSTPSAAHP
jgi:acyl-CoA thioester hydrolase